MGRVTIAGLEDSIAHHRELACQLQKRLSIRRQEAQQMRKELFRAQESARIANEEANRLRQELTDFGTAYDAIRDSHIVLTLHIAKLENRSLWGYIRDRFDALIAKSLTTEQEYYGILVDPAFRWD